MTVGFDERRLVVADALRYSRVVHTQQLLQHSLGHIEAGIEQVFGAAHRKLGRISETIGKQAENAIEEKEAFCRCPKEGLNEYFK